MTTPPQGDGRDVDVSIEVSGWTSRPRFDGIYGGIRITVAGEPVAHFVGDRDYDFAHQPEYWGVHLPEDYTNFVETLRELYQKECDVYEERVVEVTALLSCYVLQPVEPACEAIRIAFRVTTGSPTPNEELTFPTPESARGYVVDRDELARAFVTAGRDFVSQAHENGIDPEHTEWFRERVDEFEATVESAVDD